MHPSSPFNHPIVLLDEVGQYVWTFHLEMFGLPYCPFGQQLLDLQNLTKEAISDLTWWMSLNHKVPMQSLILPQTPSMTTESDASNKSWGARQGELSSGRKWSLKEPDN